jgi:UDP-N-acetylglucosamine:LPS N-acetylglucosamine transferase
MAMTTPSKNADVLTNINDDSLAASASAYLEQKPSDTTREEERKEDVETGTEVIMGTPQGKGLKVLFLSSDTGGGHRASAESLATQFEILYPGSTYQLLDLASEYLPPYNSIVSGYKHLSAHPSQWKLVYGLTNSRAMERVVDTNIKMISLVCERSIRKQIQSYEPDVVVSVHPLMTSVPILSCAKISHETGKNLPMFTVVTDLGGAHSTWFANGVEKMFVGSEQIYNLAKKRGKVPDEKLVLVGLPIRHDFSIQAEKLGDRMSSEGMAYQLQVRKELELPAVDRKTLLVMGGGEGVGSLSNIVDALYVELVKEGIDAVILVVCGRNEKLQQELEERDWAAVIERQRSAKFHNKRRGRGLIFSGSMFGDPLADCGSSFPSAAGCIEGGVVTNSLRRILSSGALMVSSQSAVYVPSPSNEPVQIEEEEKKAGEEQEGLSDRISLFKSNSIGPIQISSNDDVASILGSEALEAVADELETGSVPDALLSSQRTEVGMTPGVVSVVGLGFVTRMAEYMIAADVLVSKAGPGTISEAAAVSLPIMLTSFLPGQEEKNVDYVVEGGFGAYCHDSDPDAIAEELAAWLQDEKKLTKLSLAAKAKGLPYAARDIVKQIGDSTLKWRELNEKHVVETQKST